METIFLRIINVSFVASFAALAVLVIRLVFKKVPKRVICLLWGMVAIRLVLPFSFECNLSLIPSLKPISEDIIYQQSPTIESGMDSVDNLINPILSDKLQANPADSINPMQIVTGVFSYAWMVGLTVMLSYALISSLLLKRKLSMATLYSKGIKQSDRIETPFVFGFFMPTIYVPYSISSSDIEYVLAHENTHIKRLDYIWKPLGFILLSVYWFNPIMWLSYSSLCKDIESACDERVIKEMEREQRRGYSEALLNCATSGKLLLAAPLAFGEVKVKERVKSVMNYKKPSFWISTVSFLLCAFVAIFLMTNPVSAQSVIGSDVVNKEESALDSLANIKETTGGLKENTLEEESESETTGEYIGEDNISLTSEGKLPEFVSPLPEGVITVGYGLSEENPNQPFHDGIDLAAPMGTPVMAAYDGIIVHADYDHDNGNSILVKHSDEYHTEYNHLSEILVKNGDTVKCGDVIGYVGSTGKSTGPHLHFGVIKRVDNELVYIEPVYK